MISTLLATTIRLITGVQARWVATSPALDVPASAQQAIYFANHQSNLDAPVIWTALPQPLRRRTRPVAGRDYWDATPIRRLLAHKGFNAVLIERKKVTRSNNPLVEMENALAAGDSLIIFPEGTRSMAEPDEDAEETVAEFKAGLYHLAKKFPQANLVPTYLENLNRILPKGEIIVVPVIAAVRFGPPIHLLPDESKPNFLARARQALIQLEEPEPC